MTYVLPLKPTYTDARGAKVWERVSALPPACKRECTSLLHALAWFEQQFIEALQKAEIGGDKPEDEPAPVQGARRLFGPDIPSGTGPLVDPQ